MKKRLIALCILLLFVATGCQKSSNSINGTWEGHPIANPYTISAIDTNVRYNLAAYYRNDFNEIVNPLSGVDVTSEGYGKLKEIFVISNERLITVVEDLITHQTNSKSGSIRIIYGMSIEDVIPLSVIDGITNSATLVQLVDAFDARTDRRYKITRNDIVQVIVNEDTTPSYYYFALVEDGNTLVVLRSYGALVTNPFLNSYVDLYFRTQ